MRSSSENVCIIIDQYEFSKILVSTQEAQAEQKQLIDPSRNDASVNSRIVQSAVILNASTLASLVLNFYCF